jgi:hypothetical protein
MMCKGKKLSSFLHVSNKFSNTNGGNGVFSTLATISLFLHSIWSLMATIVAVPPS